MDAFKDFTQRGDGARGFGGACFWTGARQHWGKRCCWRRTLHADVSGDFRSDAGVEEIDAVTVMNELARRGEAGKGSGLTGLRGLRSVYPRAFTYAS